MKTFKEAQDAYHLIMSRIDVPDQQCIDALQTLEEYFALAETAAPQVPTPGDGCPAPAYYGGDQFKCLKCGRMWDRDEDKPDCGIV